MVQGNLCCLRPAPSKNAEKAENHGKEGPIEDRNAKRILLYTHLKDFHFPLEHFGEFILIT